MLPEHVEMLRKMWKEDERVERGIIAEDEAVEIDFKLQRALNDDLTVEVTYHNGFDTTYERLKLLSIQHEHRLIKGRTVEDRRRVEIPLIDVLRVDIR